MSFNKTKADPELGRKVNEYLTSLGVNTPIVNNGLSRTDKIAIIEQKMTDIMNTLGLDLNDDSLSETPNRVAKMYINEVAYGLDYDTFPKCTAVDNKMKYDEMIVIKDINIKSLCEHHLVTIDGTTTIAYIPGKKVLGLSKFSRVADHFARRPQIQERLTEQIFHALEYILETDNIAVLIDAVHYCVRARGVSDENSSTITSKLGGCFKTDNIVRSEFMNLARKV